MIKENHECLTVGSGSKLKRDVFNNNKFSIRDVPLLVRI